MGELNEAGNELLDLVAQVRTYLEFERMLGVTSIEVAPRSDEPPAVVRTVQPAGVLTTVQKPVPADPDATVQLAGLAALSRELEGCTRCKLSKARTTIVFGEGKADAALVFVGEGPGQEEDEQGRPFVGAAGQLLTGIIEKGMLLPRTDVYICNIVKCRPPEDRKPEPDEIEACMPFLERQFAAIEPTVIIALGNGAAQALLGARAGAGITKIRGNWHEYHGIRVMPTFHPAYLLKNPSAKREVWADIQKVMAALGTSKKG